MKPRINEAYGCLPMVGFAVIAVTAFLWLAGDAHAQAAPTPDPAPIGGCGKRDAYVKMLNEKYQEYPRIEGLVGQFAVMEIYVSKKGTWTVLQTFRNGQTCMTAAGGNWQEITPTIPGKDT